MTEPYVRPDVQALLGYLASVPGPRMPDVDAATARQMYFAMKDIADPPVGELGAVIDLEIPGPAGPIPARLFDPRATRDPGPAVVFFHGGGFVIGNVETHASFCAEMARVLDLPVISIDYRLAPENPWPAAPDDCEAAARWIATSPEALGRKITGLVPAGDSAGGTLTITTAMALRDEPAAVPVIAQFPIYPAADMATEHPSYTQFAEGFLLTRDTMEWFNQAYQADLSHHRGSPMEGSIAGLPPAVVVTASLDPIRDQGRAYAAELVENGVPTVFQEARGNIHGFITLRQAIPSSQADVARALNALKQVIATVSQ
jgi:acetyl esterase